MNCVAAGALDVQKRFENFLTLAGLSRAKITPGDGELLCGGLDFVRNRVVGHGRGGRRVLYDPVSIVRQGAGPAVWHKADH
jgi:hypothetical protein